MGSQVDNSHVGYLATSRCVSMLGRRCSAYIIIRENLQETPYLPANNHAFDALLPVFL